MCNAPLVFNASTRTPQVTDPVLRKAIEGQIQSFGQTPSQLLTTPHPPRGSTLGTCPSAFSPLTQEVCCRLKLPSNSPIVGLFCNTHPSVVFNLPPSVITISANCVFTVNKWNKVAAGKSS